LEQNLLENLKGNINNVNHSYRSLFDKSKSDKTEQKPATNLMSAFNSTDKKPQAPESKPFAGILGKPKGN